MSAKLFINYRRQDTAPYAGRLYDLLTAHFGEDQVFMDIDQIEPGEDFVEAINRTLSICDVAIVTIGPSWLHVTDASGKRRLDNAEDFVRMEIAAALRREISVIPVLVGGVQMPRKQDLPKAIAPLSQRNAIELSETRFHGDVNRLIAFIEKSFTVVGKKAEPRSTPTPNYVGSFSPLRTRMTAEFYQKAADQGDATAQFNLGLLYLLGVGVARDVGKALGLWQEAADQGYAAAQFNLGVHYENGWGVPEDLRKARELYQKAADQGFAEGYANELRR